MNHEQDQSHYPLVNTQKAIEHGHGNTGFTWIYSLIAWRFPIVSFVCLPGRVIWGGLLRVAIVLRDLRHSKPIWTPSQTGDVDRQTSSGRFSPSTTSTQFEQQGAGLDLQVPFFGEKKRGNKRGQLALNGDLHHSWLRLELIGRPYHWGVIVCYSYRTPVVTGRGLRKHQIRDRNLEQKTSISMYFCQYPLVIAMANQWFWCANQL